MCLPVGAWVLRFNASLWHRQHLVLQPAVWHRLRPLQALPAPAALAHGGQRGEVALTPGPSSLSRQVRGPCGRGRCCVPWVWMTCVWEGCLGARSGGTHTALLLGRARTRRGCSAPVCLPSGCKQAWLNSQLGTCPPLPDGPSPTWACLSYTC